MKKVLTLVAIASLMFSCSEKTPVPETEKIPINISVGLQTRANDSAFETEDEIGLYVVNYDGATAGTLKLEGNQADNTQFTFDGSKWNSTEDIYWKDKNTPADFYAYYPYSATIASIEEYPFSVQTDQSVEGNFWASDFLWGKSAKVSPTPLAIPIKTNHIFSRAVIDIKPGNGFTEDAWNAATKSISIQEVKISATIDLSTGVATATGDAGEIVPFTTSTTGTTITYKAMIVPQEVADNSKLIVITVDGTDYVYRKGFTFKANTEHSFSITVNKTEGSVDMSIGEWTIDENLNEGEAIEENVGEIPDNEIWYTATQQINPNSSADFGASIISNEWDSTTGKGVITFDNNVSLIGDEAFSISWNLSSITIPNGVTKIGDKAFYYCQSLNEITGGDNITSIGDEAFHECRKLKNITVSNKLMSIGVSAFKYCNALENIIIPESVTSIGDEAFFACNGFTNIVFENNITSIGSRLCFCCEGLISVTIGKDISSIKNDAFYGCTNLNSVYCKAINPPTAIVSEGTWAAFGENATGRKIYVPIGSGQTYKESEYWDFYASDIEEKEM